MHNFYRYSINTGEAGGIVFADTKVNAMKILFNKYKDLLNNNFTEDSILVWKWVDDDYYDKKYLDVIECYGS